MTTAEFSNEFDVLYNNIMSNGAPGLNEYEKSVLLTKAQEEIVKNYFDPAGNKYRQGLDDSPKRQIDFSELIKVGEGVLNATSTPLTFSPGAKVYDLPADLFLIINESVETDNGIKQVVPVSYQDYTRLMSRPYKEPVAYQAWRLTSTSTKKNQVAAEIIVNNFDTIKSYKVRYIKRPQPIITVNLTEEYSQGLTIGGITGPSECELNPIIHSEVLQRAVELAKAAYEEGSLQASVQLGQRSE